MRIPLDLILLYFEKKKNIKLYVVVYFSFPVHAVPANLPQNFSHYRLGLVRNKDLKFMVKAPD